MGIDVGVAAIEALFLTREGNEADGVVGVVLADYAGAFEDQRYAAGVVIGAGDY